MRENEAAEDSSCEHVGQQSQVPINESVDVLAADVREHMDECDGGTSCVRDSCTAERATEVRVVMMIVSGGSSEQPDSASVGQISAGRGICTVAVSLRPMDVHVCMDSSGSLGAGSGERAVSGDVTVRSSVSFSSQASVETSMHTRIRAGAVQEGIRRHEHVHSVTHMYESDGLGCMSSQDDLDPFPCLVVKSLLWRRHRDASRAWRAWRRECGESFDKSSVSQPVLHVPVGGKGEGLSELPVRGFPEGAGESGSCKPGPGGSGRSCDGADSGTGMVGEVVGDTLSSLCDGCGWEHDCVSTHAEEGVLDLVGNELTASGELLARRLQRAWKLLLKGRAGAKCASPSITSCSTSIEANWKGAHEKKYGTLVSHVRFLQWLFRSVEKLRAGAWATRSVPKWVWGVLRLCRRKRMTKCFMGKNLADQAEFDEQKVLAHEMLDWYGQYVAILRRLSSGEAPRVFDDFCGGGAVGEGIRRGGGVPYGMDIEEQPSYKLRFAPECFLLGDGVDWSLVRRWQKRHRLRLAGASPPCKFYSTARQKGEAKQPPLIGRTRDMLMALFDWWWIENVMGAKDALSAQAVEVDGLYFGLRVFRSRLFETNFPVHVDEIVRSSADKLRARCCLGYRNRWRTFDEFGRPYLDYCCQGNVFVPIGDKPWRCTQSECAEAMGLDMSHMPYDRLAQAVPPDYSQWIFGQMCMSIVQAEYGCPAISFDEMKARPAQAKRVLAQWLRGVGADQPSAGMSWVTRHDGDGNEVAAAGGGVNSFERVAGALFQGGQEEFGQCDPLGVPVRSSQVEFSPCPHACTKMPEKDGRSAEGGAFGAVASADMKFEVSKGATNFGVSSTEAGSREDHTFLSRMGEKYATGRQASVEPAVGVSFDGPGQFAPFRCVADEPRVDESTFRELYYAHFGGYTSQWSNLGSLPWLNKLRDSNTLDCTLPPRVDELMGKNTYVEVSADATAEVVRLAVEAVHKGGRGTRITLVTSTAATVDWASVGFTEVNCETTYGEGDALRRLDLKAAWIGKRAVPLGVSYLKHDDVRSALDVRDGKGFEDDRAAKSELTWTPISHDASLWRNKGMPADVEAIMTEGVKIDMDVDVTCFEVPQYPYPDAQSLLESLLEADRALAVGHMEYVPDEMVNEINEKHVVHPWLMVWQGKWRLCQDYSDGTNRAAFSAPFGLPSPWDARSVMKPESYMSKYDLRDFFWSIPVHRESRKRLVMRHPGTGRLMWCRALPFGYLDSPRQACRVSEALAGEMRRRAAGMGINFLCYVDDFLIVGDTKELTQRGEEIFEDVMREFGMQWAPSKHRGPVQCLEFLGLLICNVKGHRCIALTEERQLKLRKMIDEWMRKRRVDGGVVKAPPVEIAKLLGHLVFASQVVPGGRTYMQNMMSVFGGLEIDWKHGRVRPKSGHWDLVVLREEFWIDLEWWSDHLEVRNCIPMDEPQFCEAVVSGTDASDWGAGTVIWMDGHKEECNLAFTQAEKRRPINFRELLGIVRVLEMYGSRLRGFKVMIETDNMAAKGAADKLASTAASMQEMLRRLYELAGEFGIIVKVIHTPGAKLFRPDQTSRGDPIEEPRLRLNVDEYRLLELRFGPFTEFVGAERRHPQSKCDNEGRLRLWLHPAHNTVGSALRLLGERLAGYDGDDSSHRGPPPMGVVVVPFAPEAQWWSMVKHFACVGRWEAGSFHLEMNQMGSWKTVRALRPSIALVFPRSVGSHLAPVELPVGWSSFRQDGARMGYVEAVDCPGRGLMLPLVTGSFVYSPGLRGGRGELLMIWHSFHPEVPGRELDEEGELRVSCAELLLKVKKGARSIEYAFDKRAQEHGGSFANGGRQLAWELSVGLLWIVDHLVSVDAALTECPPSRTAASPKYAAVELEKRSFFFDFRRAEKEIKMAKSRMSDSSGEPEDGLDLTSVFNTLDLSGVETDAQDADAELAAARQSANEAAEMRKRQVQVSSQERKSAPTPPVVRGTAVCRYVAQRCEGCNGTFEFGERIMAGCRAMVHQNEKCLGLAKEKLAARKSVQESSVASARMASLADSERLVNARVCLEGQCTEHVETKVMCLRGCGRGIHLVACLNTSAYYAAAGRLVCVTCRLSEIMTDGDVSKAPASLTQRVTLAMVAELTTGAVSTAAGRDQYASLERRWVSEMMADASGGEPLLKLPRHNIESFLAFLWWLVTDADRARSFATVLRAAGAVMSMLQLNDWTKTARVKAQVKDIEKRCGVEADPCTQTTHRIIEIMMAVTIRRVSFKGKNEKLNMIIEARTMALLVLELLAGLRVGEATASGDLHGLEANNLCFLKPASASFDDGLGETVEVKILDSKTGPGRHSAFVATTKGQGNLPGGLIMRHWLDEANVKMDEKIEGGFKVEHPNYWVVRVNLASFTRVRVAKFVSDVEATLCDVLIPQVAAIRKYARERYEAKNLDAELKYVNVIGGTKKESGVFELPIAMTLEWLEEKGYGRHAHVVPGPLIRATLGTVLTHMPLTTKSTYTHLIGAMKEAYDISKDMREADEELDLQGLAVPKFGNHSLRRHSDKVARETMHLHAADGIVGVTKQVIDYFYGWLLKEMRKDMQLHYAGLDRPARRMLARVSMYF